MAKNDGFRSYHGGCPLALASLDTSKLWGALDVIARSSGHHSYPFDRQRVAYPLQVE